MKIAKEKSILTEGTALVMAPDVAQATVAGIKAYVTNKVTPTDDAGSKLPELSDAEFAKYAAFLKDHGDGGELLNGAKSFYAKKILSPEMLEQVTQSGRATTIMKKLLALGDEVQVKSGNGFYQGNAVSACMMTSHGKALKALWQAVGNGASDEEAIKAYIEGAMTQCAKTSFAGNTWTAALQKLASI